jgi:hypothetical protein
VIYLELKTRALQQYTGEGAKDHILSMSNMNGKLTSMDMGLPKQFLVT